VSIRLFHVDAFTPTPFAGNPASVCLLGQPADDTWMKAVAAEMNLSETAFVVRDGAGADFQLRWFTPAVEVALCGHATLASAHTLWTEGLVPTHEAIRFHTTKSGVLTCTRVGDVISMDFPARLERPADAPEGLAAALGVTPVYVGRNVDDYLVLVEDEATVRRVDPDFRALRALPVRGIIVTARSSDPAFDFVSRFFAPAVGVDEDPVTGSAHCCLGPFWQGRLGKDQLTAYQASKRGGVVSLRMAGDRVHLGGQAVTVTRGDLAVG
jgi:PhzF family phenazine biosynthesis protein